MAPSRTPESETVLAGAPQGATCIDGEWSPAEVPRCRQELHPRLR